MLQPLVILNPQTHIAERIITLTNRGLLTCTSIKGVIEWSKQTKVRWSEFDESSDQLPLLSAVDRFITVSGSIEVLFFSLQGKLVARVPLEESLNYPVQCGESQFGETRSLLLQQRGGLLASDVQQLHQRPVISAQIHTLASRVEVSADSGQRRQRSQTLGQRGSRMRQQRREGLSLLRGSEIFLHNQQHVDPRPTIS